MGRKWRGVSNKIIIFFADGERSYYSKFWFLTFSEIFINKLKIYCISNDSRSSPEVIHEHLILLKFQVLITSEYHPFLTDIKKAEVLNSICPIFFLFFLCLPSDYSEEPISMKFFKMKGNYPPVVPFQSCSILPPIESVVSQRFILKDRIWSSRSKKSYLIILF